MILRIGACGGLLVIMLWSWDAGFGTIVSGVGEQSMPELRGSLEQGDLGKEFSLGLVRTRALLEMRRYKVPSFFPSLVNAGRDCASITEDPFADEGDSSGGSVSAPPASAVEMLRAKGIEFEGGATASYDGDSSTLVVTNRPAQLDVGDRFVSNLVNERVPKQIKAGSTFVEIIDHAVQPEPESGGDEE